MTKGWIVRSHFSDVDVVQMIPAAEKNPSSASAAKRMEVVLFKDWMAAPKTPDDPSSALKIDHWGQKLAKDPMFTYWMKFLDDYNKIFPGKNIERTALATTCKDQELWGAVQTAKKNPKTKELGTNLENEVLKEFILAEKQPMHVARLMNVKGKTDANWKLWDKCMKDYNKFHLREIKT